MGGRANIRVAQQVPSVEQGLRGPVRYNGGVDQHSNDSSHAPTISAFMKTLWKHPLRHNLTALARGLLKSMSSRTTTTGLAAAELCQLPVVHQLDHLCHTMRSPYRPAHTSLLHPIRYELVPVTLHGPQTPRVRRGVRHLLAPLHPSCQVGLYIRSVSAHTAYPTPSSRPPRTVCSLKHVRTLACPPVRTDCLPHASSLDTLCHS